MTDIETERILLARLSAAIEKSDAGEASDVEAARQALRQFYRELGMHP